MILNSTSIFLLVPPQDTGTCERILEAEFEKALDIFNHYTSFLFHSLLAGTVPVITEQYLNNWLTLIFELNVTSNLSNITLISAVNFLQLLNTEVKSFVGYKTKSVYNNYAHPDRKSVV